MACRQCYQCSIWERLYLVVTMLGLLMGIGFALYGLFKDKVQTSDSSYLFIYIINSVFALIYAVKGIKYHDPYDLAILVLSVAPPVIYLSINFIIVKRTEVKLAKKESKILVIIFAIFSLVLVIAGLCLMVMSIKDLHKRDRAYKLSVVATFASILMIFLRVNTCIGCYPACQKFGTVSIRRVYQTLPQHNPLLGSTQVERSMYGRTDSGRQ